MSEAEVAPRRSPVTIVAVIVGLVFALGCGAGLLATLIIVALTTLGSQLESRFEAVADEVEVEVR